MAVNLAPSKPQPKPTPLSAAERERLARYDATPDTTKTEDELLDQLRLNSREMEWRKYLTTTTIRSLLPRESEVRRGLITDVTEASPYKREYVGRIRDCIAANYIGD
ncbi:hypothetical protein [Streptomyces sp. NPDC088847]|uniref:hypothetical protein n=1 Tax=Streptomyces sp. NPDC088847 TaxID=3365909 RepID=UPI0037F6AB94